MDYSFLVQNFIKTLNDPLRLSVFLLSAIVVIALLIYVLVRVLHSDKKLKYEFVTIIAHKFRTPLSQIKWALDDLISSEQDSYKKESLEQIRKSNENLIGLTTTLIELTDSDNDAQAVYRFQPVNLCDIVHKHGEVLKQTFHEKNLFFSIQCEEGVYALVDPGRFDFVLQTVMENAFAYSPPGRNIDILVYNKKGKSIISVTDNGIGMDAVELAQAFTKFFRANAARSMDTEGFGVGLYLARSVVERHHGKIEAFSAGRGQGSTFVITLPKAKAPAPTTHSATPR